MQILVRLYPFLILFSVLGFHKGLIKFIFGAFIFMDCVTFLKHLALDYEFGCGFLLFGNFKQISEFLAVFFLLGFGLKLFYSDCFSRVLYRFICHLRRKSVVLENGFYSRNRKFKELKFLEDLNPPLIQKLDKNGEKSNLCIDSDFDSKTDSDSDEESENYSTSDDDDDEYDVSKLRKLLKIERHRANEARAELEKERAASATAADEAMAMILRLQNEKSLIEMESNQYKRLAEEKQIHDQEVIQSLQWLVWRHESERSLLEDQLKLCRWKLNRVFKNDGCEEGDDEEDITSSFNGNICDALENVFYSSRDANV